MPIFDYSRLRGRIREIFGTQAAFAQAIHIGPVSLSKRLNNELEFTGPEMMATADALRFDYEEIPAYFFVLKV